MFEVSCSTNSIPGPLRYVDQWVAWQGPSKVPLCAFSGKAASTTNYQHWGSLEDAFQGVAHDGVGQGLGFVLNYDYTGIDLDGVVNPDTGEIVCPEARRIVDTLDSYTEISPSGTGLHILVEGPKPAGYDRCRCSIPGGDSARHLEIYDHDRYLTMTGRVFEGRSEIHARPDELRTVLDEFLPVAENVDVKLGSETASRTVSPPMGDDELVSRARGARNGTKFGQLYDTPPQENEDKSVGDFALLGMLRFWTQDRAQLKRLFLASARGSRSKKHEPRPGGTLLDHDIDRVLSGAFDVYTPPRKFRCTDQGNGERFADRFEGQVLYCEVAGGWYVWDGKRYARDETDEAMRMAKGLMKELYTEARDEPDDDIRKELVKHALRSQSHRGLKATVELAKSESGIARAHSELDRHPWFFNVANGTIDLSTGELRPHRRRDILTKVADVNYDPQAPCDRWEQFLTEIFPGSDGDGDTDLIDWLQRVFGYSLVGEVPEEMFFVLHGSGSNGKSTLVRVLRRVFEDYGQTAPITTFIERDSNQISNDLARLDGARLVIASESEKGQKLTASVVKSLTGRDTIVARYLHREFFEFDPQFTLMLVTNHKPRADGSDRALFRRVKLIPFEREFPEGQRDEHLDDKLMDELPGILAWCVRGCLAWQERGLKAPAADFKVVVA